MKRLNTMLLIVLAAAMALFGSYLFWVHNNLDSAGPVICVEETLLEVSVEDDKEKLLAGVTAMDDRDGDVTSSLLVESIYGIDENNMTTVVYAAFDRAGNVTKIQRPVRYKDYEPPKFKLTQSLTYTYGSGFDVLDHVGAEDLIEGDISRRIHATLISDTRDVQDEGSHQVKFQVTNSLGDTAEVVLPVDVYAPEWYTADVELSEYLIYLKRGERFLAQSYLERFIVRGEPIDLRGGIPADVELEIFNNVRVNTPGVYEVTYILTRDLNLTSHSGIAKLIVIVE